MKHLTSIHNLLVIVFPLAPCPKADMYLYKLGGITLYKNNIKKRNTKIITLMVTLIVEKIS